MPVLTALENVELPLLRTKLVGIVARASTVTTNRLAMGPVARRYSNANGWLPVVRFVEDMENTVIPAAPALSGPARNVFYAFDPSGRVCAGYQSKPVLGFASS